jgi:transcriptional regulator with XRE-family HTH domain
MQIQMTLRAARVNLGLTLKQAAKEFDINHDKLASYEMDSTNVPRSFFIKIESVYGVPVNHIFFGKQEDFFYGMKNRKITVENA